MKKKAVEKDNCMLLDDAVQAGDSDVHSIVEAQASQTDCGKALEVSLGDVGKTASCNSIDRIKLTTAKKERIAILPDNVVVLKTHYNKQCGSYICFNGKCCQNERFTIQYLLPAFRYDSDRQGEIVSEELLLGVLVLNDEQYRMIMDINRIESEKGGVTAVDLIIQCIEEQPERLTIKKAGPNKWRSFTESNRIRELMDYWRKHRHECYLAVALPLTPQQWAEKMANDVGDGVSIE
jgi:hypothetical protein